MKLPDVRYARPSSLDEAIRMLADAGGDAKILSGGQSLMPLLALRLAAPRMLVDLAGIAGLDQIRQTAAGWELGARVRWRDIERHAGLRTGQPLLAAAIAHVAHYQIRNRGTIGGSLAHADPAAELPAIAVTCDATIVTQSARGVREIKAADFFIGPLTTVLDTDEIVVALRLPAWTPHRRWGFQEFSRRRGDFALAGVAVFHDLAGGRMVDVHVGAFGVGDTPVRLEAAQAALEGRAPDAAAFEAACATAAAEVNPNSDVQADADYRRALLGTLLKRALNDSMRPA